MKKYGLLLPLLLAALVLAAGCGGSNSKSQGNASKGSFKGPGKACGAGYVRAKMPSGAVKCLVHGEDCKKSRAGAPAPPTYKKYGFKCTRGRLD